MAIPDVQSMLKMLVLGAVKNQMIDDLMGEAVREEEASLVHSTLASGYESTGAEHQEMRELLRSNYHQNKAILLSNAAIMLMLTDAEF